MLKLMLNLADFMDITYCRYCAGHCVVGWLNIPFPFTTGYWFYDNCVMTVGMPMVYLAMVANRFVPIGILKMALSDWET